MPFRETTGWIRIAARRRQARIADQFNSQRKGAPV